MKNILTFKKGVKTVFQSEASECGLACLAMIANYHSHDVSLSYMRSLFPVSHRGMNLAEMVDLAGHMDLDAQGLAVTNIADLPKLTCPALLHWNGNHFVVLEKVVNGVFHVHDPAFGERTYSIEDMERHFSGVAMEFEPRIKFSAIKAKKASKFWAIFRSCRGIEHTIAVIVILSFAANLFALASPIFLQIALDTVIPQYDLDLLVVVAIGMVLFTTFDSVSRWLRDVVTLRALTIFELFFTRNIVGHAFRLPLQFFEKRHPGDFLTRLSSIDEVRTFLISGFVSSATDGVMSILLVTLMFYYSPTMAAVSVGTLIIAVAFRAATYPKIARLTNEFLEARSEEQGKLIDGLKSAASLKVHNTSEFFSLKWFDSFTRYANTSFRTRKLAIDTDLFLHMIFMLGTVATLYIGVTDVMKSTVSIGILYAFFSLRTTFFNNMNSLIMNLLQVSVMRVHLDRLDDVIDQKEESDATHGVMDRSIRKTVALENVTIQFEVAGRPILDKVNLTIDVEGGEAIAIVGESGSGKSSLLKVFASLHQPHSGRLLIDGQPMEQFGLHEYRANIGAVFAEDVLFAGSVADNLSMYAPDVSREEMVKALRAVGLLDEIYRLPQGFATALSDESPVLSTGQRRRLMLARAFCRQPRLLLLDEVTANLDPHTEDRIAQALTEHPAAKILVTHSERLLRRVDRVFKVIDGNLVEIEPVLPRITA